LAALLPLAAAIPASTKKDLTAGDWNSIQTGFTEKVWNKAAEYFAPPHISNDEEKTVWQVLQEKEEFSKIVKLIKVSRSAGSGRTVSVVTCGWTFAMVNV
jgi:hypothetical protein